MPKHTHAEGRQKKLFVSLLHGILSCPVFAAIHTHNPFGSLCLTMTESCSSDLRGSPPIQGQQSLYLPPDVGTSSFSEDGNGDVIFPIFQSLVDSVPHWHSRVLLKNVQKMHWEGDEPSLIFYISHAPFPACHLLQWPQETLS